MILFSKPRLRLVKGHKGTNRLLSKIMYRGSPTYAIYTDTVPTNLLTPLRGMGEFALVE